MYTKNPIPKNKTYKFCIHYLGIMIYSHGLVVTFIKTFAKIIFVVVVVFVDFIFNKY